MFFRLLLESFHRQRRRKLLAGVAILLGTTAVTAMLALATTIGDRIHQELAVYGANIVITPKADQLDVKIAGLDIKPATGGAYLHESDLEKLKTIFWSNNITGVSPEFDLAGDASRQPDLRKMAANNEGRVTGQPWPEPNVPQSTKDLATTPVQVTGLWFDHAFNSARTGAPALHPWWRIDGSWPKPTLGNSEFTETAIGKKLATALGLTIGDTFSVMTPELYQARLTNYLRITGIVSTGDQTENQVLIPLEYVGFLAGEPDAVSRVEVSARTKPEDAFARKDPATLSPTQYEIWHCRPYANSIADDIEHAIPNSRAQQLRRVEQTEGTVLTRISGLMWLISAAALLAAGFAVSAAMATAILERRAEIGLMRSLGASRGAIALLFYAETALLALAAGTLGYLLGSALAATLGAHIFSGDTAPRILIPALLPITVGTALLVALAGSTPAIRAALRLDPSAILRADA